MTKTKLAIVVMLTVMLIGCAGGAPFTRTIYVEHGTPVRLRATIRNVPVWIKDKNSEPVPGIMDLPEGWFCLPKKSNYKDKDDGQ